MHSGFSDPLAQQVFRFDLEGVTPLSNGMHAAGDDQFPNWADLRASKGTAGRQSAGGSPGCWLARLEDLVVAEFCPLAAAARALSKVVRGFASDSRDDVLVLLSRACWPKAANRRA